MRRLLAVCFSSFLILALIGCSKSYETRLKLTLERMQYLQRLDQYLQAPAGDALQQLGIYIRPPKPLTKASAPGLTAAPEEFDVNMTFLDASATPTKGATAPAATPVVRMHVLARAKQAQAASKKGEPAPPPVERTPFPQAVVEVLARDLGGLDPAEADQLFKSDKKRLNDFRRLEFEAANGDIIRAYLYKLDDYEVALIWDIPKAAEQTPTVRTGRELTLEALAVGPKAVAAFQGIDVEDGAGPAAVEGEATAVPGVAF